MAYKSGDVQLLREGYLFKSPDSSKYLSVIKKWQRKWFRLLENGDLQYFDTDKSTKPGGTIPLLQCYRVFDPRSKGLQVSYCLGMEVLDSVYYIKAETAAMYNIWLDLIAAFAEKKDARPASPSSSPSSSSPIASRRHTTSSPSPVSEVRGHRGGSVASRTASVSAKVRSAEKSGWLYKTGPSNKGWNHRFFILSSGKLSYYKTEKAEKVLGSVDLHDCTGVSQASFKKGYGLIVQVPNRAYHITADSQTEQEEWIAAISIATSLLSGSKLSVAAEGPGLVRSGSGSSQSSITSRDLLAASTGEARPSSQISQLGDGGSVLAEEDEEEEEEEGRERRSEKDSVVQLLEAEVDALRGQVSSLHDELQSSSATTAQLQSQLLEARRQREREVHSITVDRDNLHAKLSELESAKASLESVNDSLRLQLDEVREEGAEVEEEGMRVRGDLEEAQTALATAEEDIKVYQQELTETQQNLQEIQKVAQKLQSQLARRDSTSSLFRKSLSNTPTDSLLSSLDMSSHSAPVAPATVKEEGGDRRDAANGSPGRREEGDGGSTATQTQPAAKTDRGEREAGEGGSGGLGEERLKWQMEMENLRRECEQREGEERERHVGEVREWAERVAVLEEKCRVMAGEVEEGRRAKADCDQARERLRVVEGEVAGVQERATQLQREKEKALADLNNIRKINRTIEKRLSESAIAARGSHNTEPLSPPAVVVDEGRLEELTTQLDVVQRERDQLQAELERLRLSNGATQSAGGGGGLVVGGVSPVALRSKSRATVAISSHTHTAPSTYTQRSGSFSNVATSLTNGHSPSEGAPPKPQRPPQRVINSKMMTADHHRDSPRPQTWGTAMFQNIFRGHNLST